MPIAAFAWLPLAQIKHFPMPGALYFELTPAFESRRSRILRPQQNVRGIGAPIDAILAISLAQGVHISNMDARDFQPIDYGVMTEQQEFAAGNHQTLAKGAANLMLEVEGGASYMFTLEASTLYGPALSAVRNSMQIYRCPASRQCGHWISGSE